MEKKTPILFTLYEPETGEVKAEYATFIVPFGILEIATEMANTIDLQNLKTEDINALGALVVELYGHKFELDDVKKYADVTDTVTVMTAIMTRAQAAMPKSANPPKAGK